MFIIFGWFQTDWIFGFHTDCPGSFLTIVCGDFWEVSAAVALIGFSLSCFLHSLCQSERQSVADHPPVNNKPTPPSTNFDSGSEQLSLQTMWSECVNRSTTVGYESELGETVSDDVVWSDGGPPSCGNSPPRGTSYGVMSQGCGP